ncbi:hypothetical protein JCM6882_009005 [Rhodosporidiobolus microsporus]
MSFSASDKSSSADEDDDPASALRSLRHSSRQQQHRLDSRLSDISTDSTDSEDDGTSTGGSASSGESSGSSDDEKHGWQRRRRRDEAGGGGGNVPLMLAGGCVLLVVVAVAAILIVRSSSDDSAASSPSASASGGSTLKASSSSGTASASGSKTATAPAATGSVTPSKDTAWVPVEKVRGVNLGSLFIFEPLGCADYDSEWPCIKALGIDTLQSKFEEHWSSFYTKDDFEEMASYGLNTVRVPLGYWTVDSLIGEDEHFPRGSMKYVKQVLSWAKEAGLYAILDLHGAPGSQTEGETFTGHKTDSADFFNDDNFKRAYDCLTNWTTMAHTDEDFSNVVAIHIVNEPLHGAPDNLISTYYPGAQKAIRDAEAALDITCDDSIMDKAWGSGDPTKSIDTSDRVVYDDHNYAQWIVDESERTRDGYLKYLCTNTRSTDMDPVIVGEWSLSTIGGGDLEADSDGAQEFFQQFAAAQMGAAEKSAGWVFWSWKTELGSSQWGYKDAVKAGFIPEDLGTLDASVCEKYG